MKRKKRGAYKKKVKFNLKNAGLRNFLDPIYKKFRKDVKIRDNGQCQFPGCGSKKRLEVHHIKTWSEFPALRFQVSNGITLCNKCHKSIKGKEVDYEHLFKLILEWQVLEKIKKCTNIEQKSSES